MVMGQILFRKAPSVLLAHLKFALLCASGTTHINRVINSGEQLRLRTNDVLARRLLSERWFEPSVRDALRIYVRPGMTVLDVGANIGYYSVQLSRMVGPSGRVICFEPQPAVLEELKFNLGLNGCQNATIMPLALSDANGTMEFFMPIAGQEAMGGFRDNGRFAVGSRKQVQVARLDDILPTLGANTIDLMKIDAEGAEMAIFNGSGQTLGSSKRPIIIFEGYEENCKAFGHSVSDLHRLLVAFGYEINRLDEADWIACPR